MSLNKRKHEEEDYVNKNAPNKRHRFCSPQEEESFEFIKNEFGWGVKKIIGQYIVEKKDGLVADFVVEGKMEIAKWLFEIFNGEDDRWTCTQPKWTNTITAIQLGNAVSIDDVDWYIEHHNFYLKYEDMPMTWSHGDSMNPRTIMPNLGKDTIERATQKMGEGFYLHIWRMLICLNGSLIKE